MRRRRSSAVRLFSVLVCCLQAGLPGDAAQREPLTSPHRRADVLDTADAADAEEIKAAHIRADEKGAAFEPTDCVVDAPAARGAWRLAGATRISLSALLLAEADEPRFARPPPA